MTNPSLFPKTAQANMSLIGPAGQIEAISAYPKILKAKIVVVLCHPHPLFQGTMHNKVITALAKAYEDCGLATLRFNYRGVGQSEGVYGNIQGEVADALAVYEWLETVLPDFQIAMAGFSFGAFIAAAVANQRSVHHLISVAPAVNHASYDQLTDVVAPWLIVQGEADEVVPVSEVLAWEKSLQTKHKFILLPGVSHFFHGQLLVLRESVREFVEVINASI